MAGVVTAFRAYCQSSADTALRLATQTQSAMGKIAIISTSADKMAFKGGDGDMPTGSLAPALHAVPPAPRAPAAR